MRDKRWACIVAHRRAGKTVACINELLTRALATSKKNGRYAYVAPFLKQAKSVAWQYLLEYGAPITVKKHESELWIELVNGSRITVYGADNADSLRGLYLDGVILDEYADMRPSVWGTIIRPMLADRRGWAVFIGTPKGHNAFYDVYRLSTSEPGWFSLMLRASTSGLLAADELIDARRGMTEDQYGQEFECDFEAAILGAVYGKWMSAAEDEGRITAVEYDPKLPVQTAWDLGYDDATAIWFYQVAFREIRLIDYYEASGEDIGHYCDVVKDKPYTYSRHNVPHDAANKLLAAGGRSIVEQAQQDHGMVMHVIPSTSQQNSIEAMRLTLEYCWFDRERCNQGIEAFKQYQFEFDEERKMFRSKPRHDWSSHAVDAGEIIAQTWRNPPPEPAKAPHPLTAMNVLEEHKRLMALDRDED